MARGGAVAKEKPKPRKRYRVKIHGITNNWVYSWAPSEDKALANVLARYSQKIKSVGDALTELREELKAGNPLHQIEHAPVIPRGEHQLLMWED